jgi:hypothetical protein
LVISFDNVCRCFSDPRKILEIFNKTLGIQVQHCIEGSYAIVQPFCYCRVNSDRLHKEIEDYVERISPSRDEEELREFTVNRIVNALESEYPICRVSPFGSYATGLYLPNGYY